MTKDAQDSPPMWVPVEHRRFGLDRRTFGPALIALVISLLLIYGWQAVNAAVPWHNEIRAGDVLDLGRGATAVPPVGWQLESGELIGSVPGTSPTSLDALLVDGGVTVELRGASFTGTANAFLDQVRRVDADDAPPAAVGNRSTVTTDAGLVGVAQTNTSPSGDGIDVAFKTATGADAGAAPALLVRVRTTPGRLEQYRGQIQALLRSITPEAGR